MALLLLASSMFVMTSCNDNGDEGGSENGGNGGSEDGGNGETDTRVEYKVVVKDQNGAAVAGASIMVLKSSGGSNVPVSTTPTLTDASGEAKFSLDEGTYTAMIMGGDSYEVEGSNMKAFNTSRVAEFTVKTEEEKETLTYTIKVVDQDGNAVAGVRVQACTDACTPFKNATDENGETSEALEVKEAAYKAQLTALPEGYTEQLDEDGDPTTLTKYAFDADRTVTIVLVKN